MSIRLKYTIYQTILVLILGLFYTKSSYMQLLFGLGFCFTFNLLGYYEGKALTNKEWMDTISKEVNKI